MTPKRYFLRNMSRSSLMERALEQRAEFIRFEHPTSRIHDDDAEVIGLVFQRRARSALDADYHLARK